jgi:uncharacterized protein (DUF1501 family)
VLHPAFAPISSLIDAGRLAAIPAIGSPDTSRSHFEAQDLMESGLAPRGLTPEGWLARALEAAGIASSERARDPFSLVAIGDAPPLAVRGADGFAIRDARRFGVPGASPAALLALRTAYAAPGADPVASAGLRALDALSEYTERVGPSDGARRPRGRIRPSLLASARQLTGLHEAGLAIRAACLEGDGWDSHQGQGADDGQVATRIRDLAEALAHLDATSPRPLVVVMSEFGRTVRQNGSRGTDHGHGGTLLVSGEGLRGGVHGAWAGLSRDRLHEGRDLPVLTDYRSALVEILGQHLGVPPVADVFPGFTPVPIGLFG